MKQALFKVNQCVLTYFIDENRTISVPCFTITQARNYLAKSRVKQQLNII